MTEYLVGRGEWPLLGEGMGTRGGRGGGVSDRGRGGGGEGNVSTCLVFPHDHLTINSYNCNSWIPHPLPNEKTLAGYAVFVDLFQTHGKGRIEGKSR